MPQHPISLCMIVKNEEKVLRSCLESVRPHVAEICIVDTGSSDRTMDIAREFTDIVIQDLSFNDEDGKIARFDAARQRSLDLASHDWVLWLDADDVLVGGENLARLTDHSSPIQYLFDYEYSHDHHGNVLLRLDRERLSYPRRKLRWTGPVHEILTPIGPSAQIRVDDIRVVHRRQEKGHISDPGRNLRILEREVLGNTPRSLFYLAREYRDAGRNEEAIRFFRLYLQLSGWGEEKYSACCDLAELLLQSGEFEEAQQAAFQGVCLHEQWDTAYLRLSKIHYCMAQAGVDTVRNWERCVYYAQRAMECPPRHSIFPDLVEERKYTIHVYLNYALSQLGRIEEALISAQLGLQFRPTDESLKLNVRVYQEHLGQKTDESAPPARSSATSDELPSVTFFSGPSYENWDPETIESVGNGGSEIAMVRMAKSLREIGHPVQVYNAIPMAREFDGVSYTPFSEFRGTDADVFVSSRVGSIFDHHEQIRSRLNLVWVHDVSVFDMNYSRSLHVDHFLCLSRWHADYFLSQFSYISRDQIRVTRNGIRTSDFSELPTKSPKRLIWSSSPDRGLDVLLDAWPDIRYFHPDAELHVFYGFENWKKSAAHNPDPTVLRSVLGFEHRVRNTEGVIFHGRISPSRLSREFLKSSYWVYPTTFTETSCISAMEAQAAGCHIVTTPIGALPETVGLRGTLLDPYDPQFRKNFTRSVIEKMDLPPFPNLQARNHAMENMGWEVIAKEWQSMFKSMLKEKASRVVPHMRNM